MVASARSAKPSRSAIAARGRVSGTTASAARVLPTAAPTSSSRGATGSTFFVLAAHHDPHDGAAPETYDALRPKLVETILETGAEIGLHGSYTAADDRERPFPVRPARLTLTPVTAAWGAVTSRCCPWS